MEIVPELTDEAILAVLGLRLERHRIEADLTQAQLAREAGVAKRTLERIESGAGCELTTLIRILRVLKLVGELNALIPELPPSPVAQLKLQGRRRQRVRSSRRTERASKATSSAPATSLEDAPSPGSTWKWGK